MPQINAEKKFFRIRVGKNRQNITLKTPLKLLRTGFKEILKNITEVTNSKNLVNGGGEE